MSEKLQTAQQYWDERSELFSNYYSKPTLFDKLFRKGIYTRVAVALKTCKQLNNPTILDIGSGPGINSVTFVKNSSAERVVGIDFAPNMIEFAEEYARQELVADKCEFIVGDFFTHDFNEQHFDISIALGVLDYVEDAAKFLQIMSERSSQAYVVSWPENGLRMALRRYRYDCPLYHYTEDEIRRLHNSCGAKQLDLVKSEGGWVSIAWK